MKPDLISEVEGVPSPLGLYSNVARVPAGELVFVAGQVALNDHGVLVGGSDLAAQMRQVYENLARALESVGSTLAHVAKFTTYLVRETDVEQFFATRNEIYPKLFPGGKYPTNTLLVVERLVSPEFLIEIEAVATA